MTMHHSKNTASAVATSTSPRSQAASSNTNAKKNDDASPSKQPILAQRFRTKLCNKFATTGSCPYVHRCMFAHGRDELRTAGQNVAAGLVSEEAIRAFKREQYEARTRAAAAKKRALTTPGAVPPAATATRNRSQQHSMPSALPKSAVVSATSTPCASGTSAAPPTEAVPSVAALLGRSASTASTSSSSCDAETTGVIAGASAGHSADRSSGSVRRYRHDPYAEASAWHPLAEAAEEERASVALAAPAMALSVVSSWGASSSASSSQGTSPRWH